MGKRRRQVVTALGIALIAVAVLGLFTVRFVLTPTVTIRGRAVLLGVPVPADESLLVSADGSLANVFVHLKEGAVESPPATGEPVLVEQRNYNFQPRVFGVRVGQPVTFVNRDPVIHGVRCFTRNGPRINAAHAPEGPPLSGTFASVQLMVPMQCDFHGGEKAFAGVLDHPHFAVTGPNGTFAFPEKLRPGIYTVVAWHERLGRLEQRVVCLGPTETLLFQFEQASRQ